MGFGLDSIVASKVKPHLSKFFVDVTDENVSVGLSSFTMTNMQLRPDLFDQFGLPFTVYGTLGELSASLSLAWFVPSLSIDVKDIYLLLVPTSDVTFDAAKDAERIIAEKRHEIQAYFDNEAAKIEAEANKDAGAGALSGFINGLINTLKLTLENIHIRFEDTVTRPAHPYSAGLVLKSLSAESRGPDYEEGSSLTSATFYKLVKQDGLGAYWNSNSTIISNNKDTTPKEIEEAATALKGQLEDDSGLHYFLGPLAATAKAMVTLKPELLEEPYSFPKADVTLEMEEIKIGLTNLQFTDAAILGDSIESMNRARPFRKFRPTVPVKGNSKEWWQFAYNSISVDIRRKKEEWSWDRMKAHKKLRLEYGEEYYKLLSQDPPSDEDKEAVQKLEDQLDNFNVILTRKEMEEKYKLQADFVKDKESTGSWWNKVTVTPEEIQEYLKDNFTDEERKKLFDVVDYDPNGPPPAAAEPLICPKDWTEIKFGFKLPKLSVNITQLESDDTTCVGSKVVEFEAEAFDTNLSTFPGADGLALKATIGKITTYGFGSEKHRPVLIKSVSPDHADANYLDLEFDKNPLDSTASKRIKLKVDQLEIVYDSTTVQKLLDCFALPSDVHLSSLKQAAVDVAKDIKAKQAENIKNMSKNADSMDIDIKLVAPYILVPEGGYLASYASVLILNLGNFEVQSKPRDTGAVIDLSALGTNDEIPSAILKVAYNQFEIRLSNLEVILALAGENVYDALKQSSKLSTLVDQPAPILKTGDLVVNFNQCAVTPDPLLPKMKATITVPLIDIEITDSRLLQLLRLVTTLPLPVPAAASEIPPDPNFGQPPKPDLTAVDFSAIVAPTASLAVVEEILDPEKAIQFTDFVLDLHVGKIKLGIWTLLRESQTKEIRAIVDFSINNLSTLFKARTYGTTIDVGIESLTATYPHAVSADGKSVYLLQTLASEDSTGKPDFVKVHMFSLAKDCPKKYSTLIKQKIGINVTFIDVTLHQESLQLLMGIGDQVARELASNKRAPLPPPPRTVMLVETGPGGVRSVQLFVVQPVIMIDPEEILLQLQAKLDGIRIQIVSDAQRIAEIKLAELTASFEDRHLITRIQADLNSLEINNLDSNSIYSKILSLEKSAKLVSANILLHKDKRRPATAAETEVTLAVASPTIVILGSFLGNLLSFGSSLVTPSAKKAVVDAAKYAGANAGKAAALAKKYANDARILLDITLEAPKILLPRDDSNLEAFLANFGTLSLKNALNVVKTGENGQRDAVVDDLTIDLVGVKGSRVILDQEKNIVTESYLLTPVELKVDLSRNLSSGWYKDLPQIKIDGALQPTLVTASSDDLVMLISCLINLANGIASGKPPPQPPPPVLPAPKPAIGPVGRVAVGTSIATPAPTIAKVSPVAAAIKKEVAILMTLCADFIVHKLEFTLYGESTSLEGKSGLVPRNPEHSLGNIEVSKIVLSAKMWVNSNLEAKVVLQDVIFDDTRTEASAIKRFVVRSSEVESTNPLLTAEFKLTTLDDGANSTFINLQTTSLELILNMQYINLLGKYAAGIFDNVPKPKKKVIEAASAVIDKAVEEIESVEIGVPKESPLIDADINVAGVRIVVLENPNSLETNAILLSIDANFLMKTDEGVSYGKGVFHIGSFTSKYENGQFKPLAAIICPAQLDLVATIGPKTGVIVDLTLSNVNVHFSAGTLLLVSKIVASFSASIKSKRVDAIELDDHSHAWAVLNNDYEAYAFLDIPEEEIQDDNTDLVPDSASTTAAAPTSAVLEEIIRLMSGCITISIEVGAGVMATPLLLLETNMKLQVQNWSTNFSAGGNLDLVCAYNNMSVGMWEYIVETVEIKNEGFGPIQRKPWEMKFNVAKPRSTPLNPMPLQVSLTAADTLELTISKSAIAVLTQLASSFSVAVTGIAASEHDLESAPVVVKNFSGSLTNVNIDGTAFYTVKDDKKVLGDLAVEHGSYAKFGLELGGLGSNASPQKSRIMNISIPEYDFTSSINVAFVQTRYFPLAGKATGLTVDVVANGSSTFVVLRGAIEVYNELENPVDVYTSVHSKNTLVGTVKPGKFTAIPVLTDAATIEGLTFKMKDHTFTPAYGAIKLLEKSSEVTGSVAAKAEAVDGEIFVIQTEYKSSEIVLENTESITTLSKSYRLTLKNPLVINNLFTIPLTIISGKLETEVQPGQHLNITNAEASGYNKNEFKFTARISNHEGHTWTSTITINDTNTFLNDAAFTDEKSERILYFKFEKSVNSGVTTVNIYAPYWIVNYTGLDLGYRTHYNKVETKHLGSDSGPLMYAYDYDYGSKNTADIRVGDDGEWSTAAGINLDTVGLSIGYICKAGAREYHFEIVVELTGNQLTKKITILPRYLATNTCPYTVTLKEVDTDEEVVLESDTAKPFWPYGKESKFTLRAADKPEISPPIYLDRTIDCLVRLDNQYGGIRSNVHVKDTKGSIILSEFAPGEVPLLFVNDTDAKIVFSEEGSDEIITLAPGESTRHAWNSPTTVEKAITWTPENGTKVVDKANKDGSGQFTTTHESQTSTYKWFSFTNGIQRIFVFTERDDVIKLLQSNQSAKQSPASVELSLLLDGIGLSLVNNQDGKDILYLYIHSTDVVWESKSPSEARYSGLDEDFTLILEHGYQNYISGVLKDRPAALDGGISIDFQDFSMKKPEVKKLRRRPYQAGIALTLKLLPLGMDIALQVRKLQIDNQNPEAADEHKIILAAVPQKNAPGSDTDAPPSIIIVSYRNMRAAPKSQVRLVSGDIILQEFSLSATMGLIDNIVDVFSNDDSQSEQTQLVAQTHELDYAAAKVKPVDYFEKQVAVAKSENTINVFESFKIYTLKFYLTFTVAGGRSGTNPLKVLIMGLGSILVTVSHVHFEVNGFEVLRMRMSNDELVDEITSHYMYGIISNLYTLVLKLDVLGNPYKLLSGIGGGLTSLLTDPVQGAMDGRFIGGVADGVEGLIGGTVGGLTDSLSKITGSLGKGLEALHLRGLSDLVNVLSWGLGGVSKVTTKAEPVIEKIRPPRALEPGKYLEAYSRENNIVNAMLPVVAQNFKNAGPMVAHLLIKDQLLLFTETMALYLTIYPDTLSAPSFNWAHSWKEFSDITLTPKNEVLFHLASKGWGFGATLLIVPTTSAEMGKWATDQATAANKK